MISSTGSSRQLPTRDTICSLTKTRYSLWSL